MNTGNTTTEERTSTETSTATEANAPTRRKKTVHTAIDKILISTFVSQIAICIIIVFGFLISIFRTYNSESTPNDATTLSLIGMAISVWIGLNIYNAISKEDLLALKENLRVLKENLLPLEEDLLPLKEELQLTKNELQNLKEELQLQLNTAQSTTKKATEQMYTEILKSKFRMSSSNTASKYFAMQLGRVDPFPAEIYEIILELEDLFQISYRLYGEHISSKDNPIGARLAEQLAKMAIELEHSGTLNSEQCSFLMGYANWRWGDFLYYQARYNTPVGSSESKHFAECAIAHYKDVMGFLFSIKDINGFYQHIYSNPENKDTLCYLANDIAATYIDIIRDLSENQLSEAIDAEIFAVKYSEGIPNRVRERFFRNLGCAYEKRDDDQKALEHYKKAYQTYSGNYLCAHCIGSLYRKLALRYIYSDLTLQELAEKELTDVSKAEIDKVDSRDQPDLKQKLQKAIYWYTIKQTNNHGKAESRLVELNYFMYKLTNDSTYWCRKDEAKEHEDFTNEILNREQQSDK